MWKIKAKNDATKADVLVTKKKLACTIDCDCVNCDNPHGSTRGNIVGEQRATSRKRRRSHINFLHQTGYSYLEKQKEKISESR